MSDILQDLNKEQKEAVSYTEGPLLIVAGAGTGKTTVITRKVAYLIEQGVKPESILALTFTDKAAEEMEERIDLLLPTGYVDVQVSTFHSFGEKLLQDYGLEIGLPDFKVLDGVGQWLLVKNNLDKFDLKYYRPLGNPTRFIKALVNHFSRAKDEMISTEQYLDYAEKFKLDKDQAEAGVGQKQRLEELANAYHVYQKLLQDRSALDFGDLIYYPIELFKKRPDILKYLQKKYQYILIDEFQDTNLAQYELIKHLARKGTASLSQGGQSLTVVGDDDQSIFKFRGASISNILHFQNDFKKAKFITLVQNYRTGQDILDEAYKFIIQNNPDRLEEKLKISKKLKSNIKTKGKIEQIVAPDAVSEAGLVVQKMIELVNKYPELSWNDFAILARSHSQFEPFINKLEERQIPYIYVANQGLYRKNIILDLISYFKLLDNYHESEALHRVLRMPIFNISSKSLVELSHYSEKKTISLFQVLKEATTIKAIDSASLEGIRKLLSLVEKHTALARAKNVHEVYVQVFDDLGLASELEKDQNQRYVEAFTKKIQNFLTQSEDRTLRVFMDELEFEREAGSEGRLEFDPEEGPEVVKLMTVHSAKGLEFGNVFVVGLVDKRFPSISRKEAIELPDELVKEFLPEGDFHLQEERRLFYVAMTRAKHNLYLSRAHDYGGKKTKRPSRFLVELGLARNEKPKATGQIELVKGKSVQSGLPVPKSFSFSQISTFLKCPLEYKYQYILKVPFRGSGSMSFGSTIHRTFEKFLKAYMRSGDSQDLFSKSSGELKLPKLDELKKMYENSWIDAWYDSASEKEEFRKEGSRMINDFYKEIKSSKPVPRYLERRFKIHLGEHVVRGVIDRVDQTKDGLVIIDYKTGKKQKLSPVDKEQLILYQLASAEIFDTKIADLQYWFLRDKLEKKSFLGSDKEMEKFKAKITKTIKSIIEAIQKDSFIELDKKTSHLKQCRYRDYETRN